jgi:hypothetical protein
MPLSRPQQGSPWVLAQHHDHVQPDWRRPVLCVYVAGNSFGGTCHGSADDPSPTVNIKFHQAFVAHFQQQRLANFLVRDISAFHDLTHFERFVAERAQDILSIIQHE